MIAKIRRIEKSDETAWQSLRSLLWPDADSLNECAQYFAADVTERGHVIVAEAEEGNLCGFVELSVRKDWVEGSSTSPVAYVEGWFVHPGHRKRGIGKALLTAAEAWARDSGFTEIASETLIGNESSILAHRACGYAEVERSVHFIKPLRLTLVEFLKTVPADDRFAQAAHRVFGPTHYCCPVHSSPLEIVDVYGTQVDILHIEAVFRAAKDNPHCIFNDYRFQANDWFDQPQKLPYCPVCDANYRAILAADREGSHVKR